MIKKSTPFLIIIMMFVTGFCYSQQFSYKPINPSFGGDTFNYNWLLSSANAQNSILAPSSASEEESELDQFGESLRNQLLGQISRTLLEQQVGSLGDLTEPGSFTVGDLAVEVFESNEGLVINIFDTSNGEQTQIVVPSGG